MVKSIFTLILLINSSLAWSQSSGIEFHEYNKKSWKYDVVFLRGWKVLISRNVNAEISKRIQLQLTYNLSLVDNKISLKHLTFLRTIPIYISNEANYPLRKNEYGSLVFHPSREWLAEHRLNPNMAGSIHIINPKEVLDRHQTLQKTEFVMLHELTHAFHFYKIGFEFKPIIEAYKMQKL